MAPDHVYVPGLVRPVTVSEYAKLKGIGEAEVLASIGALKISGAFFRGQWYIEAPRNCEARLAQLRGKQQTPDSSDKTGTIKQPDSVPQRAPINEDKRQPASQRTDLREDMQIESEVARLRTRVKTEMPAYENLTNSEKKALPTMTECAQLPQPVDYGLTYQETFHALWICGDKRFRDETPEGGFGRFSYKQGDWVSSKEYWKVTTAVWLPLYLLGFAGLNPTVKDKPKAKTKA